MASSFFTPANATDSTLSSASFSALRDYAQSVATGPAANVAQATDRAKIDSDGGAYAALRVFAQGLDADRQRAAGSPIKLAEADNAVDALREFFEKQNGTAPAEKPKTPVRVAPKPKGPPVEASYVGTKVCLGCHTSQAENFGHTLMGRLLKQGKLLGMYPEGTRSPDGRLYKGKTGMARLALHTGVPVIPVAMIGTNVVNPPGSKMWRFGRVTVRFGEPMDFSRFEGMAGNHFIERAVTDEVIYELMGLSDQEYVDIYAASVKERSNGAGAVSEAERIPETAVG